MKSNSSEQYAEQSAAGIRYLLLETPVDATQFTILRDSETTWKDYRVSARVLGESHMVTIWNDEECLQEVCACTDVKTEDRKSVTQGFLLSDYEQPIEHARGKLSYRFTASQLSLSERKRDLQATLSMIEDDAVYTEHYLFAEDPEHSEEQAAITMIALHLGDVLEVETIHTYPNENTYVHTTSSFSIVDRD